MNIALPDHWPIDPMPVPPTSDVRSMSFWRWWSQIVIDQRLESARG